MGESGVEERNKELLNEKGLEVKWQRFPRCLNRLIRYFRHVSH